MTVTLTINVDSDKSFTREQLVGGQDSDPTAQK